MKRSLLLTMAFVSFCAVAQPISAAQLNTTSTLIDSAMPSDVTDTPAPKFTGAIEDMPLMPGLNPVPEDDVVFITPHSGRIADSTAEGSVDIDDVYNFYQTSLPHLGWTKLDMRTYMRDKEVLHIDAHADGKVTTVRFSVKPQS